jgi:CHAT domain-containing protein
MTERTAETSFQDLEIRIFPADERVGGYPVEITLGGEQELARGVLAASVLPWVPGDDLVADGQRLFEALFADTKLHGAWTEARGQAPRRRVRLRIDPQAVELHALPWELLHDGPAMLSAQADTPFSRYLPIAMPWSGPVQERPIRVLVVLSDPSDIETKYRLPHADVAEEQKRLEAAFASVRPGDLQVEYLDAPVTLARLEEALRKGDPHIVHYMGHGAFSSERSQTVLYLQDDDGLTRLVYDGELVSMLARQGFRPRLFFLAACESAARSNAGAFTGLAPKLVSVGVPAVVAMQDLITIESASEFGATFYQQLLEHGWVDLAVNQARSTLFTDRCQDAAVPTLLMRLKSGQLWSAEADARGRLVSEEPEVFWKTLVRLIQRKRCIPILGPRVHGHWLPTPADLTRQLSQEFRYPFAHRSELAQVAQYIATNSGEVFLREEYQDALMTNLVDHLPDELRPEGGYETLTALIQAVGWEKLVANSPNQVHRVLASLDLPLYLTTNPDPFMVEALKAGGKEETVRDFCRWNTELDKINSAPELGEGFRPTPEVPLVYHLFGSDEHPKSLVLTEDHYLDFLTNTLTTKERISYRVRGTLANSALLFVGYSLYDWEFRVIMRALVATVGRKVDYPHVAVQLEDIDAAHEADAWRFIQKYFQNAEINVFWGSSAQFAAELRERWEVSRR